MAREILGGQRENGRDGTAGFTGDGGDHGTSLKDGCTGPGLSMKSSTSGGLPPEFDLLRCS